MFISHFLCKYFIYRFGFTLKHAGVAITITSITDLLAFGIGATTILPAMQSFCIYAAIGIFVIYLTMVSFFYAFFSLDQRRIEAVRNGFLCCYKHKNWTPNNCSQKSILHLAFTKYGSLIVKMPVKIAVIVLTVILLSIGSYGLSQLKAEFKFEWFLDEGTYLRTFFDINSERYQSGISGTIWVAEKPEIYKKIAELDTLMEK